MQEVLDALREMKYEFGRLQGTAEKLEDAAEAMTDALRRLRGRSDERGAEEAEDILSDALRDLQKGT